MRRASPPRPGLRLAHWLALALALAAGSDPALGQSSAAQAAPPDYRIEVVVFTQPPLGGERREQPDSTPEPLPGRMAWPLRETESGLLGYRRLAPAAHRLGLAARRLAARSGFNVLWHAAWEQAGLGPAQAPAVALPATLRRDGLSGFVRVYRQRFLHVEAELRYRQADGIHWSMSQSRRMRSGRQHYLDHPVLGVLVRIDEVDATAD